jgi:catechol 2,3-dioxygenase-like lactoylglutathione lyase family enzyme
MIDHVSVGVADYQKAKDFYMRALAPLGYALGMDIEQYKTAGFACDGKADFWIGEKGERAPGHVAFVANSKDVVEAFHKAGLDAGGTDNGAPGYRKDYSPGYYAAFVHDPDQNNIEVVWHDPAPPAA